MHFVFAAGRRLAVFTFVTIAAGLALAGCSSIDNALFGDNTPAPTPAAATGEGATNAAPEQEAAAQPQPAQTEAPPPAEAAPPPAEAAPPPEASTETPAPAENAAVPAENAAPSPARAAAPPPPPPLPAAPGDLGIELASVQPGTGTGTVVGQTIERIRSEMSSQRERVAGDLQQYTSLRSAAGQNVAAYQDAKSHVVVRLQVGTTRGNPELVSQWNAAQSALDGLTGNINSLAAVANDLSSSAASIAAQRDMIAATFDAMGAVDEDLRQLRILRAEATQIGDAASELKEIASQSVRRQTAFIAQERGNLAMLQDDIKRGELYGAAGGTGATTGMERSRVKRSHVAAASAAPSAPPSADLSAMGDAILTIHFGGGPVEFEKDLYDALNKALQTKPSASFSLVAVSPVHSGQRAAQGHAREVLKSMKDMGVPASRVAIAASMDPGVSGSEVRVYAR